MNKIFLFSLVLGASCLMSSARTNVVNGAVSSTITATPMESHSFSPSTEAAIKLPVNSRDATPHPTNSEFDLTGHGTARIDPAVTAAMRRLQVRVVGHAKGSYLDNVRERIASGYYDEARDRAAFLPTDLSFSGNQANILKAFPIQ